MGRAPLHRREGGQARDVKNVTRVESRSVEAVLMGSRQLRRLLLLLDTPADGPSSLLAHVLLVTLEPLVGDLQVVERLLRLLMLGLLKSCLRIDALQLILDNLYVILSCSEIVLELRLLRLLSCLGQLKLADLLLQVSNRIDLRCILLFKHFLCIPMRIRQELVNLHTKERKNKNTTYVGSFTLMFSASMIQLVSNSSSLLINASFCSL